MPKLKDFIAAIEEAWEAYALVLAALLIVYFLGIVGIFAVLATLWIFDAIDQKEYREQGEDDHWFDI